MEAKKAANDEDLSMEEILQSIRKIIAEDGDGANGTEGAVPVSAAPDATAEMAADVTGSDVLELTEVIEESDNVVPMSEPEPVRPHDVLSQLDEALATKPIAVAPPQPAAAPAQAPAAANDSLLASNVASAAAAAFKKATPPLPSYSPTPNLQFSGGATMEQLVTDLMRPMIKEWLDSNLAAMVERIVEAEVRKLAR